MRLKAICLCLLLVFVTSMLVAEATVIHLPDGTVVFQLNRDDMEKATFAMEKLPLLRAEIDELVAIGKKQELLITLIAVGGPILGFILGLIASK